MAPPALLATLGFPEQPNRGLQASGPGALWLGFLPVPLKDFDKLDQRNFPGLLWLPEVDRSSPRDSESKTEVALVTCLHGGEADFPSTLSSLVSQSLGESLWLGSSPPSRITAPPTAGQLPHLPTRSGVKNPDF